MLLPPSCLGPLVPFAQFSPDSIISERSCYGGLRWLESTLAAYLQPRKNPLLDLGQLRMQVYRPGDGVNGHSHLYDIGRFMNRNRVIRLDEMAN